LKKRTTLHDLAKELSITPATVSRALSDHPEISARTKEMVKAAALRLDYNRNNIASSLRSGKTHLIGVMIPTAELNFFGSVIHGISNIASAHGYDVLIHQSNESYDYEVKGIKAFMSARVDGIIASLARDTMDYSHLLNVKDINIPLVLFDRINGDLGIPSVVVDDYRGAYMATEHLIKQGYRRIAHISGPQHLKAFNDRLKGYLGALQANQITWNPDFIYQGNISLASGKEGVRSFMKLAEPPDAVFAVEDTTALGALKELKDQGVKVPEQFGLFGFCNDMVGEHITPSLSTVDQQTVVMGEEAFKLLYNIIHEKENAVSYPQKIVLDPLPVFRESSLKNQAFRNE
jgi:LacI family transcriptional regulator